METERAKLIQVSKLSAIGEMAAGIAHEINTPLSAMMINAELMKTKLGKLNEPTDDLQKRAQSDSGQSIGSKENSSI